MELLKKLAIVLPPGLLATLELFHASGHYDAVYKTLSMHIDRWIVVHYLQLLLFPLTAWSVYSLSQYLDRDTELNGFDRVTSRVILVAMTVFGLGYAAFDSIAGIGSAILVKESQAILAIPGVPDFEDGFAELTQGFFHSPLSNNIARIAIAAAIIGFIATAVKVYQRVPEPYRTIPIVLLAGACFGVTRPHAPPWGPLTYGMLCGAAVVVTFVSSKKRIQPAT